MVPNPSVQAQGSGQVSADQLNTYVQACASIAQMRTVVGTGTMVLYLEGTSAPNDGGQGSFYWNVTSPGPDDGVNVIVPTGVTVGAWIRLGTAPTPPPTSVASVFRAAVRTGGGALWTSTAVIKVPYDTIDFDTTGGGYSLTQIVPTWGTFPAFKVPTTGYYRFASATQFFDNTTSDTVSILKAFSIVDNTGADVEFYQFNSPMMTVQASPASSKTFSVAGDFITHCLAGYFVWVNDDLESAASSSTLQMNTGFPHTLTNNYFSGQFLGS